MVILQKMKLKRRAKNLDSNSDGSVSKEELGEARVGLKDKIKAFMKQKNDHSGNNKVVPQLNIPRIKIKG